MNDLKNKLENKSVALGTMLSELSTPNIIRILARAGYEFVIVDCEHGYFDFPQIANLVSVANGFGSTILVRIPTIEREYITKVLDMGADGLLIPMVNTREEAERIVQFAKYPPLGKRGMNMGLPHANYSSPPVQEYIQQANQRLVLLAQLETQQAIANAHDILSVEGIDAVIIGPADLSADFGAPGDVDALHMRQAIQKVIDESQKVGKPCGIIEVNPSFMRKWRDAGMTIFSYPSEVGMLLKGAKENYQAFFA